MYKNTSPFYYLPTNQYNNGENIIYNNIYYIPPSNENNIKRKGKQKNVSFNNNVQIINVESYKEYNKLYSYDIEEINDNFLKEEENNYYFENKKIDNKYRKSLISRKKEEKCCCIIL